MLDKQQIQRQFNRSAERYNGVAEMQREIVDELLSISSPVMSGGILDAGCGTGYALERLMKRAPGALLTGVDLAPKMLEQAMKVCPDATLIAGDIESLPLRNGSQDVIFSSSAVQWCDASVVMQEFNRCLRAKGRLLLSTFTDGTLSDWRTLWGRNNQQEFLSVDEFAQLFDSEGWSDVCLWQQEFVQPFTTFMGAVSSIRDLGAGDASLQRGMTPMTRSQLGLVRENVESVIEQEGFIGLKYHVAFATAIKSKV